MLQLKSLELSEQDQWHTQVLASLCGTKPRYQQDSQFRRDVMRFEAENTYADP